MAAEWIPPLANEIPIKHLQIPFGYWQLSIPTCQRRRTTCLGLRRCVISTCLLTFLDSTLWDLLFYVIRSCNMGWVGPVTFMLLCLHGNATLWDPLAISNILNATLWDLLLQCLTSWMLRCEIFSAVSNILNATLWDLLLQFPASRMLRCEIFSCTF